MQLLFEGIVNGLPVVYGIYTLFSVELLEDLPEIKKIRGDTIVVQIYECRVYVRIGDEVKIRGVFKTKKRGRYNVSEYIDSNKIFNVTLGYGNLKESE